MMTTKHRLYYILFIVILCAIGFHGISTHPWSYDDLDHMRFARLAHEGHIGPFAPTVKEPLRFVLNTYFYLTYPIFDLARPYEQTGAIEEAQTARAKFRVLDSEVKRKN